MSVVQKGLSAIQNVRYCLPFSLVILACGKMVCLSPVETNCQSLTMERMTLQLLTAENCIHPDNGMFNGSVYV